MSEFDDPNARLFGGDETEPEKTEEEEAFE